MAAAMVYGDMLTLLHNQTKPYELNPGQSEKLVNRWTKSLSGQFNHNDGMSLKEEEST